MSPRLVRDLIKAVENRDAVTAAHTWRVVLYTRLLAEATGVEGDEARAFAIAAALHDVGKLDIPAAILRKPGPLSVREFEIMRRHAPRGEQRLAGMGERDRRILSLVRSHHERWDGRGYPDGLAGEKIPRWARAFAVIDSFDAMTGSRPYRPQGSSEPDRAIEELQRGAGTQYWAPAVERFTSLYRDGRLRRVLNYFNRDCPVPPFSGTGSLSAGERAVLGVVRL